MPLVVVVSKVSSSACYAAAAVERKTDLTVPQIERYEINVLSVGHVKHYATRLRSSKFHPELCPVVRHSTTQFSCTMNF